MTGSERTRRQDRRGGIRTSLSRRLPALMVAIAALGAGTTGCRRGGEEKAAEKATPAAVKRAAVQVGVTPAATSAIMETVEVTGSLTSLNDVTVAVKAAGRLQAVFFREGDRVKAGDVVARQDPIDLRQQLEQQQAALETARTRLVQAKATLRNAKTTLTWTNDQTASAVRQAQAGFEAAQEQAKIVKQGARQQEREQAEENVAAAKADRDKARADLKRYQDLYRQQAVSAQQLDQAQAVADSADARYNSATQALSLIREGARPEDIRRADAAVEQSRQMMISAQSNRDQVNLRRADVLNAQAGVDAAEAGVRQAEAAVRLAKQAIKDADIRTPIGGVVAERKAEPGMQIGVAKPDIMRIVSLDNMYFDAVLPETQYAKVQVGMPVGINVYALPGRKFNGVVAKVFPVASAARSFTARVRVTNQGDLLRPQMFATGQIVLTRHAKALVIPRDAVLDVNGNSGRLFVVENRTAAERKVELGITNVQSVEILSGLQAGDQVVTLGQAQIQKGDKVEITTGAAALPASKENATP